MPDVKTLGRRFRRLWQKEQKLAEERRELGVVLMAALKERGLTSIAADSDTIQIIIQKQRKLSKSRVIAFFGEGVGEEFWEALPWKICEYLTVVAGEPVGAGTNGSHG